MCYSNFVPKTHRFWDIPLVSIQWPWNPRYGSHKVIGTRDVGLETWSWSRDRSRPLFEVLVLVLVSTLLVLVLVLVLASLVLVSVLVSEGGQRGNLFSGVQNTRGLEKFAIFDRNRRLSRIRYEIGPWLLLNAYMKSYALYRMMTLSMTWRTLIPVFKVTAILSNISKTFFDPWLTDKLLLKSNRKPCIVYRRVPFSMTLSDLWPGIQGHDIFWSWISEKRRGLGT